MHQILIYLSWECCLDGQELANIDVMWSQEDDDAQLLQQALAMSMEEGSSGAAAADAAMAEAAVDDQDLALGRSFSPLSSFILL